MNAPSKQKPRPGDRERIHRVPEDPDQRLDAVGERSSKAMLVDPTLVTPMWVAAALETLDAARVQKHMEHHKLTRNELMASLELLLAIMTRNGNAVVTRRSHSPTHQMKN